MEVTSPHRNHRKRLRARFLRDGLSAFEQHTMLELLLTYSVPVRDTNETAHNLISRFKSLSGVFDADYEDLIQVEGVGENSALLLKLIPALMREYAVDKITSSPTMRDMDTVGEYLISFFFDCTREQTAVMLLNNNLEMIGCVKLDDGTVSECQINTRKVAELGFARNASAFVLAHNHPHGNISPSQADINTTLELKRTFDSLGMPMIEHIIVSGASFLPMFRYMKKAGFMEENTDNTDF